MGGAFLGIAELTQLLDAVGELRPRGVPRVNRGLGVDPELVAVEAGDTVPEAPILYKFGHKNVGSHAPISIRSASDQHGYEVEHGPCHV